ncbi:MAG: NADAR family protein [Rhodocyclaceae bacterium]
MRVINNMTLFWRTDEPFSNWHPSPFVIDGRTFNCGEQWMMYSKAMLFGDEEIAGKIMAEAVPRKQKMLGRQVRGFDGEEWTAQCEDIMYEGLLEKFRQSEQMLKAMLDTGDTMLVEASPDDAIWGIGLEESDPRACNPEQWLGQNKLGKVLMRVRDSLRASR